jgi:hypothetical protein
MCPVIMAVASIAASVAGTVVSMAGAQYQAEAGKNAAKSTQMQEEANAVDSINRNRIAEERQREKTSLLAGRQKAVMGANGLDLTTGSPLDVIGDTAALGEMDALTIHNNGERERDFHLANAKRAEMQGKVASDTGQFQMMGAALGGISSVADKWYRFSNPKGATA